MSVNCQSGDTHQADRVTCHVLREEVPGVGVNLRIVVWGLN